MVSEAILPLRNLSGFYSNEEGTPKLTMLINSGAALVFHFEEPPIRPQLQAANERWWASYRGFLHTLGRAMVLPCDEGGAV